MFQNMIILKENNGGGKCRDREEENKVKENMEEDKRKEEVQRGDEYE
jgi:hypothetical protein